MIMASLPGVGRVAQTDHVAECVRALASVAPGAPAPPVLIAGLPDAVAPARVVEAIKRYSPHSRVVLVADLSAPSVSFAALTAGADLVLARSLEPTQVCACGGGAHARVACRRLILYLYLYLYFVERAHTRPSRAARRRRAARVQGVRIDIRR